MKIFNSNIGLEIRYCGFQNIYPGINTSNKTLIETINKRTLYEIYIIKILF
jgi:hypothetical protein